MPSGYFKFSTFETIKTFRIGIINNKTKSPHVNAITVVQNISNSFQTPMIINAGIVKIIPAASDSPADTAV